MENERRLTLADVDRLDGGSFERMVQEIRKTTSDKKEIEELTCLEILRKFSQRLKKDKKGESTSSVSAIQEIESKKGSRSEGLSKLVCENKQGLDDKGFRQCLERADHDIDGKQEVVSSEEDVNSKKQFGAANPAGAKGSLKFKIRKKNNDNGTSISFAELGLDPPPNLLASIRKLVARKGGTDITLVIMKELKPTDLDTQQGRLSIPVAQVKEPNFLTEEEKKQIESKDGAINVTLIQPCIEEISLQLKRWTTSSSYVLNGGWNSVIKNKKNGLQVMDIVQLWSFRWDINLGFVLVKVWP